MVSRIDARMDRDIINASHAQFCSAATAQLEKCTDFNSKRGFLLDHIEKITYHRYQVTIHGSVPITLHSHSNLDHQDRALEIPFRIEGAIEKIMLHRGPRRKFTEDGHLKHGALVAG